MKKTTTFLFLVYLFFNLSGAVGIESLNIPVTAEALALDNAGAALKGDNYSNPAARFNSEVLSYGSRLWIDGFKGHTISYSFGSRKPLNLVFETMKDEKVKHYGAVPQDDALGNIPVSWYSLAIGVSHEIKGNQIGFKIKPFINLLYTEKLYGISLNAGLMKSISETYSVGIALKNVGWTDGDLEKQKLPMVIQGGAAVRMMDQRLNLFADVRFINNSLEKIIGFYFTTSSLAVFNSISIREESVLPGAGISFTFGKWSIQYGAQIQANSALGFPQFLNINRKI